MTTMNLNDVFMSKVLTDSAWNEISESFNFNEQLLDKFKENVNWKEISSNNSITWTSSMLEKFKERIDWEALSSSYKESFFNSTNLEKYKNYWNWKNLSENWNIEFSIEMIDRFVEKWDWNALIDNHELDNLFNEDFLNKYNQYIPESTLLSSRLWSKVVDIKKNRIIEEILLA